MGIGCGLADGAMQLVDQGQMIIHEFVSKLEQNVLLGSFHCTCRSLTSLLKCGQFPHEQIVLLIQNERNETTKRKKKIGREHSPTVKNEDGVIW